MTSNTSDGASSSKGAARSLIAYSYLAQSTRADGDLLTGLAPIFKPIARGRRGERFDPVAFSGLVGELYGLKIHPWAVEDLAPRLVRAGLLRRLQVTDRTHEYLYEDVGEEFDEVTEADVQTAVRSFVSFAAPLLKEHGLAETEDSLGDAFLRHLVDMDFIAVLLKPDLSIAAEKKASTLTVKKPLDRQQWEAETTRQGRLNVLCASFILEIYRTDQPLYQLVLRIASGALLAEVILNFQDPGPSTGLDGLTLYLDAPFVMSLVDVSSEDSHEFATDLCEQLAERGARLAMFRHSVDELRDNLKAVSGAVGAGQGYGPTARRMAKAPFKAYVASVLADPETAIRRAGVAIAEVPTASGSLQYCTVDDEERIRQALGYYERPLAQSRDAQSLSAIIRLRRGKRVRMGRFPSCGSLFVTENSFVAERPNRHLKARELFADGEVPPAVTDRFLAGLIWVIFGGQSRELPQRLLLANCTAAVEPRSDVIRQMHRFLSEIDPHQAEHFSALMTDERAGQHLMQITLGESLFVTPDNAPSVLDQIKRVLLEEHEQKKAKEIESLTAQHESEVRQREALTREVESKARDAGAEAMTARSEVKKLSSRLTELELEKTRENNAVMEHDRRQAEHAARNALKRSKLVQVAIGLVFAVTTVFVGHLLGGAMPLTAKVALWILAGALALGSFWRIPDFMLGGLLRTFRDAQFERHVRSKLVRVPFERLLVDWSTGAVRIRDEESTTHFAADSPVDP